MNEPMSAEKLAEIRERAEEVYMHGASYTKSAVEQAQTEMVLLAEVERLRAENVQLGGMITSERDANREVCEGIAAQNTRLRAELEAAKEDMHRIAQCVTCAHTYDGGMRCRVPLKERKHKGDYCTMWQWRGPTPANCGEQGAPFDEPMGGGDNG